jgi:glutamate-1-semialdehyde 2,1-aminomutase
MLVRAGSGPMTFALPDSAGVPEAITRHTVVAEYNSPEQVRAYVDAQGDRLAAVIVEPVAANMGVVPPRDGFLRDLRAATHSCGALLIFDEVITGFRLARGGAQAVYDVAPDLTCLGKIIGGGLPVGAFGGRADVMGQLAPLGGVYQAGTLAGNPVTMVAGRETLKLLDARAYGQLERITARLADGMTGVLRRRGVRGCVQRAGSLLTIFFGIDRAESLADVERLDRERFRTFFFGMLDRGFYLPPSPFEALFVSLAHTEADADDFVAAADDVLSHG